MFWSEFQNRSQNWILPARRVVGMVGRALPGKAYRKTTPTPSDPWPVQSAKEMWSRHPEVAEAVQFEPKDDGTFWMSWEDLKYYLSSIEPLGYWHLISPSPGEQVASKCLVKLMYLLVINDKSVREANFFGLHMRLNQNGTLSGVLFPMDDLSG